MKFCLKPETLNVIGANDITTDCHSVQMSHKYELSRIYLNHKFNLHNKYSSLPRLSDKIVKLR